MLFFFCDFDLFNECSLFHLHLRSKVRVRVMVRVMVRLRVRVRDLTLSKQL